ELCQLTGLTLKAIRRTLRALEREKLLSFSASALKCSADTLLLEGDVVTALAGGRSAYRPVPIPRRVLRFLARCEKGSVLKTLVVYLVRGLTLDRRTGEVRGAGTVKASWISEVTGLSIRSTKSARAELIALGLFSKDTRSFQRKLNRDGAYFRFDLTWKGAKGGVCLAQSDAYAGSEIAPPCTQSRAQIAPPYKYKRTLYRSKNQKTHPE